ncbi:PREDICTED: uncharacterized protein DKFZp434B061 [Cercocebus atys]|uniref:uncharacterized protein DKFZp434B061 n=1 Tax=Cercocebus atys TaxID=9531 RepID=UPI0005F51AC9|nr:PREDICTED: uncharacterized protein DKFZp434B061 [Cercocebus atys]
MAQHQCFFLSAPERTSDCPPASWQLLFTSAAARTSRARPLFEDHFRSPTRRPLRSQPSTEKLAGSRGCYEAAHPTGAGLRSTHTTSFFGLRPNTLGCRRGTDRYTDACEHAPPTDSNQKTEPLCNAQPSPPRHPRSAKPSAGVCCTKHQDMAREVAGIGPSQESRGASASDVAGGLPRSPAPRPPGSPAPAGLLRVTPRGSANPQSLGPPRAPMALLGSLAPLRYQFSVSAAPIDFPPAPPAAPSAGRGAAAAARAAGSRELRRRGGAQSSRERKGCWETIVARAWPASWARGALGPAAQLSLRSLATRVLEEAGAGSGGGGQGRGGRRSPREGDVASGEPPQSKENAEMQSARRRHLKEEQVSGAARL